LLGPKDGNLATAGKHHRDRVSAAGVYWVRGGKSAASSGGPPLSLLAPYAVDVASSLLPGDAVMVTWKKWSNSIHHSCLLLARILT